MPESMRSKLINEKKSKDKLSLKVKNELIKRLSHQNFKSPVKALISTERKNNPANGDHGLNSGSMGTGSSKKIDQFQIDIRTNVTIPEELLT